MLRGCSSGSCAISRSDSSLRSSSARDVTISLTYKPAPCSRQSCRNAWFVMPAIGASTTGAPTSYGPILNPREGTPDILSAPIPSMPRSPPPPPRLEEPASVLGQADGLGPGPGAGLADRGRQVIADRPLREV